MDFITHMLVKCFHVIKFPHTPAPPKKKKIILMRKRKQLWCDLLYFPIKWFGFYENLGGLTSMHLAYDHYPGCVSGQNMTKGHCYSLGSS